MDETIFMTNMETWFGHTHVAKWSIDQPSIISICSTHNNGGYSYSVWEVHLFKCYENSRCGKEDDSRKGRGQNVSKSESFSAASLDGPEGSLGLSGAWASWAWRGRDLSRVPGEGASELQGEQKGIMVARMRARHSATSLLGAQARAGVRPEEGRKTDRKTARKEDREGQGGDGI